MLGHFFLLLSFAVPAESLAISQAANLPRPDAPAVAATLMVDAAKSLPAQSSQTGTPSSSKPSSFLYTGKRAVPGYSARYGGVRIPHNEPFARRTALRRSPPSAVAYRVCWSVDHPVAETRRAFVMRTSLYGF